MKNLLIISTHLPYVTHHAQDAIDAALAASNVGLRVSMLFIDNGVWQLQKGQMASNKVAKAIDKQISSLALFEIDDLFVFVRDEATPNADNRLNNVDLTELNSSDALNQLINQHEHVLRF